MFTTIQKFFAEEKGDRHPELSARRNIVVIAGEAHRSRAGVYDALEANDSTVKVLGDETLRTITWAASTARF